MKGSDAAPVNGYWHVNQARSVRDDCQATERRVTALSCLRVTPALEGMVATKTSALHMPVSRLAHFFVVVHHLPLADAVAWES